MRIALILTAGLILAACSKDAPPPQGNEQSVIDKANADVAAAQAEAQGQTAAPTAAN